MAELEIHHEAEHGGDTHTRRVGVLAAILAVALAIVSIASHRTHTEAIIRKAEAADQWQHYQSGRIKLHNLELGRDLLTELGTAGPRLQEAVAHYRQEEARYTAQGSQIQAAARAKDEAAERAERRAMRYDYGEGLLEIGLVLSSLFYISRARWFPIAGLAAGLTGALCALTGLLMP